MRACSYWLFKSEPSGYAFQDLLNEDNHTAEWDGVRNYAARNYLRDQVKLGDKVFFYHSNIKSPAIVGTAVVVREGYPDFTAWDTTSEHPDPKSTPANPIWFMVDIKADDFLSNEVTLTQIKSTVGLENTSLLKRARLSVHPVTREEWTIILALSKRKQSC